MIRSQIMKNLWCALCAPAVSSKPSRNLLHLKITVQPTPLTMQYFPRQGATAHRHASPCLYSLDSKSKQQGHNNKEQRPKAFNLNQLLRISWNVYWITWWWIKGGLISDFFFNLAQISQKRCQITVLSTIHQKRICSGEWFGIFLFWRIEPKLKASWE